MASRYQPYPLFFGLAVGAFVVADMGFEVLARVWIGRNNISEAISETLYYAATQPIGTLMLLFPFIILGWISASLSKKKTLSLGLALFSAGVFGLGLMYYGGHVSAEKAMLAHQWTAATLSVGLLPFQSILVLFIALVAYLVLSRKPNERKP